MTKIIYKDKKEKQVSDGVSAMLSEAYKKKTKIDQLAAEVKMLNEKVLSKLGVGATVEADKFKASLVETTRYSVKDSSILEKNLGERFSDLVEKKVSYSLTTKLKNMLEEDTQTAATLTEAISKSKSQSITYRANK